MPAVLASDEPLPTPAVSGGQAVAVPLPAHWNFGPPTGEQADPADAAALQHHRP